MALVLPLVIWAASRVMTLLLGLAATRIVPGGLLHVLTMWDGKWWMATASEWYPNRVPSGTGGAAQTTLAFVPFYPALIRAGVALGLSTAASAVLVSLLAGAAATVGVWLVALRLADRGTAVRAVTLFCFFPGSFVLSMAYAEGLLVLMAALCLLALLDGRWARAGLLAAVACLTRPNGIVLIACCAWAGIAAARRERSVAPLVAPVLASLGVIGFVVYLWQRTGEAGAWLAVQDRGWGQGFDGGVTTAGKLWELVTQPSRLGLDVNRLVSGLCVGLAAWGMVSLWRWRPPAVVTVYVAGVLLLAFTSRFLSSSPRYLLTAFPLLIVIARVSKGDLWPTVVAVSASAMAALMLLATTTMLFTP